MNALVALLALAQPASQPASAPAAAIGGTGADVTGQVTIILEVDEHRLKVQESWTLSNLSGKAIPPAELVFSLPEGTKRLTLDEETPGFVAAEDSRRFHATRPLGPGQTPVAAAYFWDLDGDTAETSRRIPVNVNGLRVIMEDIEGVEMSSNLKYGRRDRELNGLNWAIYDFTQLRAGQSFQLKISGLPSRTTLPRNVTLFTVFAIVAWMIYALFSRNPSRAPLLGPMSARARRDQIVKALQLLERDREEDKIKPKRYERRHAELMSSLSEVLREIDVSEARRSGG